VEVTATKRDTAGRPVGGWFTRKVMGRIYSKNNVLIITTGPTGIGKSYCSLKLCEMFDPKFDSGRIVFSMKEFLDLLPALPSKSFILFDECGVSIGHRTWLSPANMAISMVTQSFRYKYINVVFALPSRYYLDKVPREMCHYEIMMQKRGVGAVYKIYKSSFVDSTYTKYLGTLFLGLPSKDLTDEYEKMRAEHQDALYERLRKEQEVIVKKQEDKLEKALQPKRSFNGDVEKGMLILPQIVDATKDSDQGLIDVHKLRRRFDSIGIKLAHNRAYNIRKELLRRLHANDNQLLKKLKGDSIVGDSFEQ
jgi:hypothetical protein